MSGQIAMWKQVVVVALIAGAAGGAWLERERLGAAIGFRAGEPPARDRPSAGVPVIVAPVRMARDDLVLEAVGTGQARRSIMLRSETEGKVAEVALRGGTRYRVGDVLIRLDDTDQRLAARLAETRLAEAERVRSRIARLQDAGTAATAQLDEVRTAAEIATLEVERARDALEDRVVRAPFDGIAGLTDIETGTWVDSDTDLASFDDRSVILVEFDLPEALLARVRPGLTVSATTPAAPGERFEGSVADIDSRIEADSRTVRVRVALPNPDDRLRPGASFRVRLSLPGARYPVVPELSVLFSQGALRVWRVDGDQAMPVQVRMIRRRDGAILVEGPIAEGELVVVEGTQRLAPGKRVRVLERRGPDSV